GALADVAADHAAALAPALVPVPGPPLPHAGRPPVCYAWDRCPHPPAGARSAADHLSAEHGPPWITRPSGGPVVGGQGPEKVRGSGFAHQGIDHPAAAGVLPAAAAVGEEVRAAAAGLFEGVGEDGQAIEGALLVDRSGQFRYGPALPLQPRPIHGRARVRPA